MPRKASTKPTSTNILDYPSNLSTFERDSLASEARLKAERKTETQPKVHKP
jgi:hypothetical protein